MPYDLAIHRVGAFAGRPMASASRPTAPKREPIKIFRAQIDAMVVHERYVQACEDVRMQLADHGYSARWLENPSDVEATVPRLARLPLEPVDAGEAPLVAVLPSRYLSCQIGDFKWEMRLRASATACIHQDTARATKLWWSFEGVPHNEDPERLAQASHVADFIAMTRTIETVAIKGLHETYYNTLAEITDRQDFDLQDKEIHVLLSDNDEAAIGACLEEIVYGDVPFESIRAGSDGTQLAQAGAAEFGRYLDTLMSAHKSAHNAELRVEKSIAGMSALSIRTSCPSSHVQTLGIARRFGRPRALDALSREMKKEAMRPAYLRSISAARPLSAHIARGEARRLDH